MKQAINQNQSQTLTQTSVDRLASMIYDQIMYTSDADMGEMGDVMEAAECLVKDWIEINNIRVID